MTLLQSRGLGVVRPLSLPLSFPDISIQKGERLLLLGPSGSGKTTLLSVLAGLLAPTQGNVTFNGEDFYSMAARKRDMVRGRSFGFVFQTLHLLPSLNLRQNIALAADMAGLDADQGRISAILETLGLSSKAHRKPEALSQGEQQRAAIARAILNRPEIILADEPTSALDDANAKAVMELLGRQAEDTGAALLIATHDSRIVPYFNTVIRLATQAKEAA
ncbi:MAG: ABC transporter ATP-binding protein [Micavibrio sp.]|nr:ABC transporter ATP-binding protein [Micavibrio sp.]